MEEIGKSSSCAISGYSFIALLNSQHSSQQYSNIYNTRHSLNIYIIICHIRFNFCKLDDFFLRLEKLFWIIFSNRKEKKAWKWCDFDTFCTCNPFARLHHLLLMGCNCLPQQFFSKTTSFPWLPNYVQKSIWYHTQAYNGSTSLLVKMMHREAAAPVMQRKSHHPFVHWQNYSS